MALLEMIKTDELVFRQSELFGPIWIYRKKNNEEYAEEMAHETVFLSKDPDVKPGLVEEIRREATARSQAGSVGDIAAVMREALLWASRGRDVTEDDLMAMLEGREDLSEVQEDPFGDKDDDTPAGTASTEQPQEPAPSVEQPVAQPQPTADPRLREDDKEESAQDETAEPSTPENNETSQDDEGPVVYGAEE